MNSCDHSSSHFDLPVALSDSPVQARLQLDANELALGYDRIPIAISHDLHLLDLFKADRLMSLVRQFDDTPRDYFVSASAPTPNTVFFSVDHSFDKPTEAMKNLDKRPTRILLKRPENHSSDFRRLLDELYSQIRVLRPELRRQRVMRLESGIFISSAASTTPFHFDPEINFFMQIEGEKEYHIYEPSVLADSELERFYLNGVINIGQVHLAGRDVAREHVFDLRPGMGFHQPQNAPHWVQTKASRSISYAFVYETDVTRRHGRARAYNHYVRKAGLRPVAPGKSPLRDRLKSGAMAALLPLRMQVGKQLRKLRKRS